MALRFAFGLLVLLLFVACIGWLFWRSLKKNEDPARVVFYWVLSALLIGGGFFGIYKLSKDGTPEGKFTGLVLGLALGVVLGIMWAPRIGAKVGDWFGNLYTGGSTPPDPTPLYSIAESRHKQGRYVEAVREIRAQLAKFPTDVTGQLMLAEIQAEHMDDLPGAQLAIERFVAQPGHGPKNVAFALNSLADCAVHERRQIRLPAGATDIGLGHGATPASPKGLSPEDAAERLVKQLEAHPLDAEAREKLAGIYFDHYDRPDLALEQLEQLIQAPNQPAREVARWLNVIADLQVKQGAPYESIQATLQRIIDRFPGLAPARLAQQRLDLLRLELKGKEQGQSLKLGAYEKDLGLKRGKPG